MKSLTENSVILVVDDSPTNLGVLSNTLVNANFTVAVALTGEQAIEQIKYKPPDLILLDVMMPGIDGFETCRRLKSDPETCDIPIIFMTALSDPLEKSKGLSLGAVDYITKPFQQEEVLARVRVHLQLYNLTRTLEEKVEERTQELTQALHHLHQTQVQLVQREKMALFGQLVAGVAHEISNPINFISGNLKYAHQYINDLLSLIHFYEEEVTEKFEAVEDFKSEIELDFLEEDLPKTVASMEVGIVRIQEVIQALENFLRLDESAVKAVNLSEGIESTLIILGSRLKAKSYRPGIEVVKTYQNLPLVQCYVVQINQVMITLLSQAIEAIDQKYKQENPPAKIPLITIETQQLSENRVEIKISHNGEPLSQKQQQFLTNPMSSDLLSEMEQDWGILVTHQIIVDTHRGNLNCLVNSQITKLMIELPTRLNSRLN